MPVKEKENKNSPWTKLPATVALKTSITRQTIVEKFSAERAKNAEMIDFFISKINNCGLFTHDEHPDFIFYAKESADGKKEVLIERYEKNKTFYIKYSDFWSVFESKYKLNYSEIQLLTQSLIEELLNSQGYKTLGSGWNAASVGLRNS